MMKKESIGQRGKTAEKATQDHLEKLNNKYLDFAYSRLPDARAAGGRLKAAICDFMIWSGGRCVPLEVKSTEHNFRLAKDKLAQLPNLKKVERAGADPFVLVLHTTTGLWRIAPIRFFEFGHPSWDLTSFPTFASAGDALNSVGFLPVLKA
jgi:penicillin-binding protein-related factor A (putative recombinase)